MRLATPTPSTFRHAPFATPAESARVGRVRGPRLIGAAFVAVVLGAAWLASALSFAGRSTPENVTALDPFAAVLADRWRADTTYLAAYLRARAELTEAEALQARFSFEALAKEAPLYAPGWAGLGVALYQSGFEDMPPEQAMPRAIAAANRALALDATLPDAIETQIAYDLFYRWDLTSASRRLDTAIARYPDYPEFYNLLATWHRFRGELDAALDIKERNAERDPLLPRYAYQIAQSLYFAHRW